MNSLCVLSNVPDVHSGLAKGGTLLLTFKPLEDIGSAQQKVAWK